MKIYLLSSIFFLNSIFSCSSGSLEISDSNITAKIEQEDTTDTKYSEYFSRDKIDSALLVWKNIVKKDIGKKSTTYGNALLNISITYFEQEEYKKSKKWFLKIIDSDLVDSVEIRAIMQPYANYKNQAAFYLADIYIIENNLEEALKWLYLVDTTYPYCGPQESTTSISTMKALILERRVDVLSKLNRQDIIIHDVLTELICSQELESFFVANESELFKFIEKSTFKSNLDRALEELVITKVGVGKWEVKFNISTINFSITVSNKVQPPNLSYYSSIYFISENEKISKNGFIRFVKQRSFYQRLIDE